MYLNDSMLVQQVGSPGLNPGTTKKKKSLAKTVILFKCVQLFKYLLFIQQPILSCGFYKDASQPLCSLHLSPSQGTGHKKILKHCIQVQRETDCFKHKEVDLGKESQRFRPVLSLGEVVACDLGLEDTLGFRRRGTVKFLTLVKKY